MTFRFNLKLNRTTVRVTGVAGFLLMVGIFAMPALLAKSLNPHEAEREIRRHLRWQLTLEQTADMKAAGLTSPDRQLAERWQAQARRVAGLEFVSLEINRFLFVPPFSSSRMYVVKLVTRDVDGQEQTRYFSLSARSRFFEVFWVAEQSRLMWWLSI